VHRMNWLTRDVSLIARLGDLMRIFTVRFTHYYTAGLMS
jgi:hypothetical protein